MCTKQSSMQNKSSKARQNGKNLNAEARYLKTQILSNITNRILAFNNLDEGYGDTFNKQLLASCACRKITSVENMKLKIGYSCKYRFCIACSRYRSVKRRLAYAPSVDKIYKAHIADKKSNANLWFVTLTKPTVTYDQLPKTFEEINKRWRIIYKYAKKRKLKNFSGIRRLECTANPIKALDKKTVKGKEHFTYHAHLHVLVHGRSNAMFLRKEWLKRWEGATWEAQDVRKFDGNIAEVLKYVSKMVHGHDAIMSRGYSKAIGWIYKSLQKRRVFFTFGSIKRSTEEDYKAWEQQQGINTQDILEQLTDEERQSIRPDKTWAEGKVFKYDRVSHNYVADGGLKLVDKKDFDIGNPSHFNQKQRRAIARFDKSVLANLQARIIEKRREKIDENQKAYIGFKANMPKGP